MTTTIGPWSDPMASSARRRLGGCRVVVALALVAAVVLGAERLARAQVQSAPYADEQPLAAGLTARAHARPDARALRASDAGRWTAGRYNRPLGTVHPFRAVHAAQASRRSSVEAGTARGPARADWPGSREERFREAHSMPPAAGWATRPATASRYASYRPAPAMSFSRSPAASRSSRSAMPPLRSLHRGGGWRGRYR